ncbi:hypothetical protein HMI54_000846 [Coelomomyces lativittatus]|nr:hypothetical protein HMI56_003847 [Coelomomyces lativittatus]KAJ1511403.1 hypothetical protein HMI54_000846 [Coelomomyces lativittatus]
MKKNDHPVEGSSNLVNSLRSGAIVKEIQPHTSTSTSTCSLLKEPKKKIKSSRMTLLQKQQLLYLTFVHGTPLNLASSIVQVNYTNVRKFMSRIQRHLPLTFRNVKDMYTHTILPLRALPFTDPNVGSHLHHLLPSSFRCRRKRTLKKSLEVFLEKKKKDVLMEDSGSLSSTSSSSLSSTSSSSSSDLLKYLRTWVVQYPHLRLHDLYDLMVRQFDARVALNVNQLRRWVMPIKARRLKELEYLKSRLIEDTVDIARRGGKRSIQEKNRWGGQQTYGEPRREFYKR